MPPQLDRVEGLEGMRGIAAFWVFTHHYLLIFYPQFYFGPHTWINHIFNPDLAVAWFFVHSGFVLSLKSSKTQEKSAYYSHLAGMASRRYLRLVPPVLFSILITYFLMKGNFIFAQDYAALLKNEWLGRYLNFAPHIKEVIYQSFWGTYFNFSSASTYNPNLWTIGYELIASYILFAVLVFMPCWRHTFWLLLPLAFVTGPWKGLMGFLFGAFLTRTYQCHIPSPLLWAITLTGFLLSDLNGEFKGIALPISAALLMLVLLKNRWLRGHLERPFFKRLGELSYSLYVLHFAVLASFTSFVGLKMDVHKSPIRVFCLFVATTFVLWLVSEIGERWVDRPGVKFSKYCSQKMMTIFFTAK